MTDPKDTFKSIASDTAQALVATALVTKQQLDLGESDTPLTTAFEIASSFVDRAQIPGRLMAQGKALAMQGDEAVIALQERVADVNSIVSEAFDDLEPEEQERIMEFVDVVKEKLGL